MLVKYIDSTTYRPGKCKLFSYKLQVEADRHIGFSRPIPFALRPAVKSQIDEMVRDGTLKIENSPFLNPLTAVKLNGKKLRICVDGRKVNQYTILYYEHTLPL